MEAIALDLSPIINLTDEQFFQLCQHHRDYRFERTASGEIIIMPPTGGETGRRNAEIAFQLQAWSRQNKLGIVFDSSTCFKLPHGADRSPDAAWIKKERWEALTLEEREKFPPISPDFVLELGSATDSLTTLQAKMKEYIDNGVRLGWLLDRQNRRVEICRTGKVVEVLQQPGNLAGEDVLPGFILDLKEILY
ncbi:Uma2 family endonuclease [Pleurocapsales cyanobacterium LEGE 06147]|nr:Uma2 family endonuclease [Pleurocapsales cyanobacterium LEGE 06147]